MAGTHGTVLQNLDPRSKIMMMFCLSSLALIFTRPVVLLTILFFCLFLLFAGGIPLSAMLSRLKPLLYLLFILFIVQCVFIRGGEPFLSLGSVILITTGGLERALSMVLRLLVLVFSAVLLVSGEVRDYLLALVYCKIPYEIAFMVMTAIHFIPLLSQDAADVFHAVQMRGEELQKIPLRKKPAIISSLLLPILASALTRIRTMSIAMEARAFRAYPQRTYWRGLELKTADKAILFLFPLCSLLVVVCLWQIYF